jgi:hypothetical protein
MHVIGPSSRLDPSYRLYSKSLYRGIIATTKRLAELTTKIQLSNSVPAMRENSLTAGARTTAASDYTPPTSRLPEAPDVRANDTPGRRMFGPQFLSLRQKAPLNY